MEGFGMFVVAGDGMEVSPVALTGVRMKARVSAVGQRVVVEQVFVNKERVAIEAVYTFPLPAGAAVCGFEAITGERVLTGEIEELGKGMEKYEEAVEAGHGAFMAELWRPDVFSTRVGNLKPGQAVLVRLTYVVETEVSERKLRLEYPTTMAPRYGTATGMDRVEAAVETDALNPPHVLAVPYGLELEVVVDLGVAVRSVASPTHGLKVEKGEGHAWKATLAGGKAEMDRAVVLEVELAKEAGAKAWVEGGKEGESFVAVAFVPEFGVEELEEVGPREVVFVVDCSGSMEGPSIEQAKGALALCLKGLNEGDRFNVVRFGSTFQMMRPESVVYSQGTLDGALAYLGGVRADLGGTELYGPLEAVLKGSGKELVREIVLLTDGQVSNEPALVKLAGQFKGRARIFSFGIGPASSAYLVKGVAEATGGAAEFIAPGERIEEKVLRMFGRMASPRVEGVRVAWGGAEVEMEPREVGAVFDGEVLRVCGRVRGGKGPVKAVLKALAGGKEKVWEVAVEGFAPGAEGMIAACWARRRLARLELAGEIASEEAVGVSKRYGVLSKGTTLVAVEHRSIEERSLGVVAMRRVPVMLAKGWGGSDELCEMAAGGQLKACAAPAPVCSAPAGMSLHDAATMRGAPKPAKAGIVSKLLSRKRREAPGTGSEAAYSLSWGTDAKDLRPIPALGDELLAVLMLQQAEGSFGWDGVLERAVLNGKGWACGRLRSEVEGMVSGLSGELREKVVRTALALRALRVCFGEREGEWKLAYQKGMRWLGKVAAGARGWVEA